MGRIEKPLNVLIVTKSSLTADNLFEMLLKKYGEQIIENFVVKIIGTLGIFQRKIKFSNGEHWKIFAYWEEGLNELDFNEFDIIILSDELPFDECQKIANKTSSNVSLRRCDLLEVINKIGRMLQ